MLMFVSAVRILCIYMVLSLWVSTATVLAADSVEAGITTGPLLPDIVISELQTNGEGSGTTTQEFIELYNRSETIINVESWSIVYINTSGTETVLYTFTEPLLFLPQTFLIGKHSAETEYLKEYVPDFTYSYGSSGIAATGGTIELRDADVSTHTALSWKSATAYVNETTVTGLTGGLSAQLQCNEIGDLLFSNVIVDDYILATPTPTEMTCLEPVPPPLEEQPAPPIAGQGGSGALPTTNDEIPQAQTEQPTTQDEQVHEFIPTQQPPIYINEVFVDPDTPLTDSEDEFIELYNPNTTSVHLQNYSLTTGLTTTYTHTFSASDVIGPKSYGVIQSGNSSLTLTNGGGRVQLRDAFGDIIDSVEYGKAEKGSSYAFNNESNAWEWTTTPTKALANVFTRPAVKITASVKKSTSKTASSSSKKTNFTVAPPIQLNEILPNPASPQKDADDEYIELYNPHPYAINIADYTIRAGASRMYSYTIPTGTTIKAFGFYTITSAISPISLPNSGGTVILINNFDKQIDTTEYTKADDGVAWARDVKGVWRWTATPTLSAKNLIQTTATSASNNKGITDVAGVATVAGTDDTPLLPAPQPLPSWALALIGVSAVCYAVYEYRFEARNTLHKLREYRSTR